MAFFIELGMFCCRQKTDFCMRGGVCVERKRSSITIRWIARGLKKK